ncbi:hypothetical protein [Fischerella sp. JS2]|uniref:hypothetical protein n=1 Tax=Fischerella sp. JS2 TaxID=2597771 RepID=UPI0028E76ED8|nr:hypothetical protein [Fischerella sp. JS2]
MNTLDENVVEKLFAADTREEKAIAGSLLEQKAWANYPVLGVKHNSYQNLMMANQTPNLRFWSP